MSAVHLLTEPKEPPPPGRALSIVGYRILPLLDRGITSDVYDGYDTRAAGPEFSCTGSKIGTTFQSASLQAGDRTISPAFFVNTNGKD